MFAGVLGTTTVEACCVVLLLDSVVMERTAERYSLEPMRLERCAEVSDADPYSRAGAAAATGANRLACREYMIKDAGAIGAKRARQVPKQERQIYVLLMALKMTGCVLLCC